MKMDWQRSAYISGIFVLGFLLLFEWNTFTSQQQLEINQQKSTVVTTAPNALIIPNDTIATINSNTSSSNTINVNNEVSELPVPVTVSNTNDIPSVTANVPINNNRLIHISTDFFDIQIVPDIPDSPDSYDIHDSHNHLDSYDSHHNPNP